MKNIVDIDGQSLKRVATEIECYLRILIGGSKRWSYGINSDSFFIDYSTDGLVECICTAGPVIRERCDNAVVLGWLRTFESYGNSNDQISWEQVLSFRDDLAKCIRS